MPLIRQQAPAETDWEALFFELVVTCKQDASTLHEMLCVHVNTLMRELAERRQKERATIARAGAKRGAVQHVVVLNKQ